MSSPSGNAASSSSYNLVLQIAPGAGIISRKPRAVLFIPHTGDGMEKLLTAFVSAPDGHEFDAVADAVIDNDFAVPPFACVHAGRNITLRVFGAVELRTDQRSVPSLIGDHSATWIDHRIHGRPDAAEIAVNDCELDELTDLVLGTAHAGGFNLLATSTGDRPVDAQQSAPKPNDPEYLRFVLEALDGHGRAAAPPPVSADRLASGPADVQIDAEHNSAGSGDDEPRTGSRKALRFDDGTIVPLVSDIVIGRNPDRVAELGKAHPVVVIGERVSRAHLIVRYRGGEVIVEDCGSRNGSVLVPSEGQPPIGLVAAAPIAVSIGARVYFGAKTFTVIELDG